MKLPSCLRERLIRFAGSVLDRPVDQFIGGPETPYLLRWFVIPGNRFFNIYLHCFNRSDDDRALHDHPWASCSIILGGHYLEHAIAAGGVHHCVKRETRDVVFRRATAAHRIELENEHCITLFITGPHIRSWGFHCKKGWVHWRDFVDPTDTGLVGPGCGDAA